MPQTPPPPREIRLHICPENFPETFNLFNLTLKSSRLEAELYLLRMGVPLAYVPEAVAAVCTQLAFNLNRVGRMAHEASLVNPPITHLVEDPDGTERPIDIDNPQYDPPAPAK